ncbi:AraC family transcriptional regulator [Sinomicrobium pectinilyticum]|uniref:AraC family transcriptional regulator n=1 Tax=Sinomicrobium pectinilyticum TaxID=1084421 RepID=A0A3N0EQY9_SINP1|nr:AraC family transcriptional regulator [Sinomicrobium pectinilyticum]RNL90109.1 AraC family transcriptional regulator [Sinomicrobium pectinilyticum]
MNREPQNAYVIDFITGSKHSKTLDSLLEVNGFTAIIVNTGYMSMAFKEIQVQVNTKDLFIVTGPPDNWAHILSEQCEIWVFSFDPSYFYGPYLEKNASAFLVFLISLRYSKLTLTSQDFSMLVQWFMLLYSKRAKSVSQVYEHKIVLREIQILLRELGKIYFNYTPEVIVGHPHRYTIAFQFLRQLELHFREQHGVQFYADSLYLSADHLSRVVKKVTRKTAKQCIEEKIMNTAKALLLENKAIAVISTSLGFKTTSHFCYFFKKHTSYTTSSFRKFGHKINLGKVIREK